MLGGGGVTGQRFVTCGGEGREWEALIRAPDPICWPFLENEEGLALSLLSTTFVARGRLLGDWHRADFT